MTTLHITDTLGNGHFHRTPQTIDDIIAVWAAVRHHQARADELNKKALDAAVDWSVCLLEGFTEDAKGIRRESDHLLSMSLAERDICSDLIELIKKSPILANASSLAPGTPSLGSMLAML